MITDRYLPLDQLLPDPSNYNRASLDPEQVATLAAQILEVGFTNPFLVDENTNILAAGARRRMALLKLRDEGHAEPPGVKRGWKVPCRVGTWSEIQRLKVAIGDNPDVNRIDYDMERLGQLLGTLVEQDELRGSGYDEKALEKLLGSGNGGGGGRGGSEEEPDEEAVPEAWMVVIHCTSEPEQVALLEELEARGLNCQAVVT